MVAKKGKAKKTKKAVKHGVVVESKPLMVPDQRVLHTPVAYAAAVRGDLDNTLVAQIPGGIERQEAKGQQDSNAQRTLPIKMDWGALEKLGFKRGEADDNLFLKVEFPLNWNKLGTNHSLWSYLIDDRGRIRGDLFYKAAFYDRAARGTLRRRYSIGPEYPKQGRGDRVAMAVEDQEFLYDAAKGEEPKVIHRIPVTGQGFEADDKADAEIRAWMKEHYPEWEDPLAYWS